MVDIGNEDPEWGAVEEEMQSTIRFYNCTYVAKTKFFSSGNQNNCPFTIWAKAFAAIFPELIHAA